MPNTPRSENQLQTGTRRIQDRWTSMRKNELKPLQFHLAHGLVVLTIFAHDTYRRAWMLHLSKSRASHRAAHPSGRR
jgi:hypothetical protein